MMKTIPPNKKRILYIRFAPYVLSFDSYNLQEVGLGKAFCNLGYDFDIVYYAKENKDQVIRVGKNTLTILWRKGVKLLRTGIFPHILDMKFLNAYDSIIVSEYSQIMGYLVAKQHDNVYLYHGPYYNMFKLPFVEPFYDALFCKKIDGKMKKAFCKTQMAADFLNKKGITNTVVTGVGLDVSKYDNEVEAETDTEKLLKLMEGKENILYVGSIIPRKNIELIIKAFAKLKTDYSAGKNVQLVLVGKGDTGYEAKCKALVPEEIEKDVIWYPFIKNAQLKFIYQKSRLFLLPSVHEIFGMVLLEAMYFGLPVISSSSAGAETLIDSNKNGVIVHSFEEEEWSKEMSRLLEDSTLCERLGSAARQRIIQKFMWREIAEKMHNEGV